MFSSPGDAQAKGKAFMINMCRGSVARESAVSIHGGLREILSTLVPTCSPVKFSSVGSTPSKAEVLENGLFNAAQRSVERAIAFIRAGRMPEKLLTL